MQHSLGEDILSVDGIAVGNSNFGVMVRGCLLQGGAGTMQWSSESVKCYTDASLAPIGPSTDHWSAGGNVAQDKTMQQVVYWEA